jgi:hypothetical protein
MKVWNVTDKKTPELERLGLLNVQVQVGDVTLKPGESTEVEIHLRAEIAPLLRQKLLSETDPNPPAPPAPKAEAKPPAPTETPPEPPALPPAAETPSTESKSQGRRPRGE